MISNIDMNFLLRPITAIFKSWEITEDLINTWRKVLRYNTMQEVESAIDRYLASDAIRPPTPGQIKNLCIKRQIISDEDEGIAALWEQNERRGLKMILIEKTEGRFIYAWRREHGVEVLKIRKGGKDFAVYAPPSPTGYGEISPTIDAVES